MKTLRYLLMIGFALVWMQANSQSLGIKGGLNVAGIGGDSEDADPRIAYHAGVFYNMKINDVLGFQPEIVYSSQGAQAKDDDITIKAVYDYVNVPLMVKYYANENLSIQGGPQVGILTSAKAKFEGVDVDIKDELETVDVGIGLGLGYEINKLQIMARYNYGLTNTAKDAGDEHYPNRVFQIGLGYFLK